MWLTGEAAMAGRENQGDLWDLASGLDLQPPIVCAGFRTLSLASVQNLGRWDARLMKLALDRAEHEVKNGEPCVWKEVLHLQIDLTEIERG